jgi:RHH-type rel operon transcriptional repressor/antitoxin RelB
LHQFLSLAECNRVGQFQDMIAVRLDIATEARLERLAKKTGHTKTYFAREAILEHLADLEDVHLAQKRLKHPAKIFSARDVKRELGL